MGLLRRQPVTGGDVFDLQIIAAMQANGVERIYTFSSGRVGVWVGGVFVLERSVRT